MTRTLLGLGLAAALLAGCQKARPYDPRPVPEPAPAAPRDEKPPRRRLPADVDWQNPGRGDPDAGKARIDFVDRASRPAEWAALKAYWNEPPAPKKGEAPKPVRIKVPLGLDDPRGRIPPHSTPTRAKWELGRKLFFDAGWLDGSGKLSCATCHIPSEAFADGKKSPTGQYNTPSLVNCAYNSSQFWDGRATYLEEVVQQKPEDELSVPEKPFRHAWPGVVARLRKSKEWTGEFKAAFDLDPNQTTVGQAVATYLRTLLAGDSLHDRAELARLARGDGALAERHYASVLDAAALKRLGRREGIKAVVAADLARGHAAFVGPAGCAKCHPPSNGTYSDQRFHNLGAEPDDLDGLPALRGRFGVAPLGEKNRSLMGAFKTPTLRGLPRTGPYLHNGQQTTIEGAVRFHFEPPLPGAPLNIFLDPDLADEHGAHRKFKARNELDAIVLFLRALDGEQVDPFVRTAPPSKKP